MPDCSIRPASPADRSAIQSLARATLTSAYRLSPQQIDLLVEDVFAQFVSADTEDDDSIVLVAEGDAEADLVGVGEAAIVDDVGTIRWLLVDPVRWGNGIGTALWEHLCEELDRPSISTLEAHILEANTEGHTFLEAKGFEQIDQSDIELAAESLTLHVYRPEAESQSHTDAFPNAVIRDEGVRIENGDEDERWIDPDDPISGTMAALFTLFANPSYEDQHGFYCSHCGATDASMDSMQRIECEACGNTAVSRGSKSYDASYL